MSWLRRVRGALGIGLAWAVPWWIVGAALSPLLRVLAKSIPPQSVGEAILDGALIGWYGFLAGAAFSVVLTIAGRRRTFHDLTARRMVKYAVASSALLMGPPMVYMLVGRADGWRIQDVVYLAGGVVLTVGCSIATLMVARKTRTASYPQTMAEAEASAHSRESAT